jgi:hypothetical protein
MAYCTKCGAPLSSEFCTTCGTPAGTAGGASAPAPQAPAAGPVAYTPTTQPAAAPPGKKHGPLFWILLVFGGLVVLGGILVVSGGLFFMSKLRQAGVDPALMQKSPGLAMAKILAATNPDIEILSVDEDNGIIRVRDKKTGKTMAMNLKDAQNGKIVFVDDKNQQVEIQAKGEGENASVEIKGPEGAMRMGTGTGQLPDWLPSYPRAQGAGMFGMNSTEGKAGSYGFKTNDSIEDVTLFYENALKNAGFEVERNEMKAPDRDSVIMLTAKDSNSQRTAHVTVAGKGGTTTVNLVFETKK